jgi:glycerate-2-kinase
MDNAGAILAPDTLMRARELGLNAKVRLSDNDGYGFFSALNRVVPDDPTAVRKTKGCRTKDQALSFHSVQL